jgi:hypothetical protein
LDGYPLHISRKLLYDVLRKGNIPRPKYSSAKYDKESLENYLASHPETTYAELARYFKGSDSGARHAMEKYGLKMKIKRS